MVAFTVMTTVFYMWLYKGDYLYSPGGAKLIMDTDGELRVRNSAGTVVAESNTGGWGHVAKFTGDGTIYVYDNNFNLLWDTDLVYSSQTYGSFSLTIADSTLMTLTSSQGGLTDAFILNAGVKTTTVADSMFFDYLNSFLCNTDSLPTVAKVVFQGDGNLVAYVNGVATGASGTYGSGTTTIWSSTGQIIVKNSQWDNIFVHPASPIPGANYSCFYSIGSDAKIYVKHTYAGVTYTIGSYYLPAL